MTGSVLKVESLDFIPRRSLRIVRSAAKQEVRLRQRLLGTGILIGERLRTPFRQARPMEGLALAAGGERRNQREGAPGKRPAPTGEAGDERGKQQPRRDQG